MAMNKLPIYLFLLLIIFFYSGCATRTAGSLPVANNHPLVGTWVLVSSNNSSAEGEYQETIAGGEREFVSAAGGRYELNGDAYIESLDYASWEDYKDSQAVFTWRLDGGRWYHKGVLNSPDGNKFLIEEVWERVDVD
jgi:hypothetical protein